MPTDIAAVHTGLTHARAHTNFRAHAHQNSRRIACLNALLPLVFRGLAG